MSFPRGLLDAFETAQRSIFRLETLQHYAGDPNFDRFVSGGSWQDTESKDSWCDLVRRRTREGVVMQRVQLVKYPLSDYMRFRFAWSNPPNIAAGEEVRILLEPTFVTDFWMFDDRDVWLMNYTEAGGEFLHAEQVSRPSAVEAAITTKRRALERSTPLVTHTAAS